MSNLDQIQQDIEQIRADLNGMIVRNGSLSHPEVTKLSARLDDLIVSHARLRADQSKTRLL